MLKVANEKWQLTSGGVCGQSRGRSSWGMSADKALLLVCLAAGLPVRWTWCNTSLSLLIFLLQANQVKELTHFFTLLTLCLLFLCRLSIGTSSLLSLSLFSQCCHFFLLLILHHHLTAYAATLSSIVSRNHLHVSAFTISLISRTFYSCSPSSSRSLAQRRSN